MFNIIESGASSHTVLLMESRSRKHTLLPAGICDFQKNLKLIKLLGQKNQFLKIAQPGVGEKGGLCGIGISHRLCSKWTLSLDLSLKLKG